MSSLKVGIVGGMRVINMEPEIRPAVESLLTDADEACQVLGRLAYEGDEPVTHD
jgi:hypothetical protein